MAEAIIKNKFLHYKTDAAFQADLEGGFVQSGSIVFIKDVCAIWSHGKYFYCSSDKFESSIKEITDRLDVLEGDDTVEGSIENLIKEAIEAGLGNSKTLKKSDEGVWETAVGLKYVAADDEEPSHIALVDKDGTALSTITVSDIIGNGILKSHSYDKETGKLTLTFAQASGEDKTEEIDLSAMLDINDVLVDEDSKDYLDVDLTGAENSQAVFKVLVKKLKDLTGEETGLADAADVKAYVDEKVQGATISIEGDDYVEAATGEDGKVSITTNTGELNVTKEEGGKTKLSGTEKTLVGGKEIADKVDSFVNARLTEELEGLDAVETGTGTNVEVKVTEEDGKITSVEVEETYATITRVSKTDETNPSLTVTDGTGLVTGTDIEAVKGWVEDIVEEGGVFVEGTGSGSAVLKDAGNEALNKNEVAIGKNNVSNTGTETSNKTAFSIGNGTETDKSNAFEVRENGDVWINLGSDFQKLQTILSNEIDWYEGN